jgi:hypothetical protein
MNHVPICKTEDQELPVPSAWRLALKGIADALVLRTTIPHINGFQIGPVENDQLGICRENIKDYPDPLGPLTAQSWNSSVSVWNRGYWAVLVDLTTRSGEVSDLVFHAKVTQQKDKYLIEPGLIYVP